MLFVLTSCTDNLKISDSVILIRDDQAKKSEVNKMGAYCSAAFYRSIENLLLHKDGTINDGPWHYKWTIGEYRSDQDKAWFDANCKEPPNAK